jgi:branched-chain amino acid transport system substrate-binding protein
MKKILPVLLAAVVGLSCAKKAGKVPVIKIGALFAVTGPAAFLGAPEAKTARMVADELNAKGGAGGFRIELIIRDTKGVAENAVSFARQLIEEDRVFAIIGPSTSGETMAIKNLCEKAGVLLLSCAAAEIIVDPVARYVFKTPPKDSHAALLIFNTMKKLGIHKIGVISGNTGFGNAGRDQLEKLAPENNIEILASEVYGKADTDLTGVLTKLKARKVQAVVNWSIVPAQSIAAKNMRQIRMDVPLFQSHGFGNIKYVRAAGQAGEGVIFPCGRLLVAESLADDHPQKAVLAGYKQRYEEKFGEAASTFGGHAYDALMIIAAAVDRAGADREKVRNAIENLKGFVGTGGVFNFSPGDHNGLGPDAFEMLTVKNGEFVLYQ